jgi:3-phosphoshikimate 1-carboxyvinyltransferase
LKPAEDALHWDNHAERTIEQAVQQVLAWWEQRQPFAAAQRP